jgi:ubiquitin-conjugating enzyme E2 M
MIDAANDLAKNRDAFIQNVKTSMRGGSVRGETFDKVLI